MIELDSIDRASWELPKEACDTAEIALKELETSIQMSVQRLGETILPLWESMVELLERALKRLVDAWDLLVPASTRAFLEVCREDYWDFVPARIRYLAFHHPKARVRKKNWNRMWKIRERYLK